MKNTAIRFGEIRDFYGISQADMAEKAGVSRDTWRRYERGDIPTGDTLLRLSALGFSVDWLITGEGAMRSGDEAEPAPVPQPKAVTTDHRLIGRLTEKIMLIYKEMGIGIALHQAAERAAQEHDRIVADVPDPDDRLIQIGVVMTTLREELRAKAASPSSSKHRA
jgi:transcriptional regulator with XRE-family HTH domain